MNFYIFFHHINVCVFTFSNKKQIKQKIYKNKCRFVTQKNYELSLKEYFPQFKWKIF